MKAQSYYLIVSGILMASWLPAQSLSQSVIALAGGYEKTPAGLTVSWTVGEPIVDPLKSGDLLLTQGFQQPDLQVTTGFSDPTFGHDLKVFPNPTSAQLILETDFERALDYRIVDVHGKMIREGELLQSKALNISSLPQGIYAIYFTSEGRMINSQLVSKK